MSGGPEVWWVEAEGFRGADILCREFTLVKHFKGGIYAQPLCCRSWTCDYCRPDRKRRVARMAARGRPDTFITLTINPRRNADTGTDARELVEAWRKFVKHAKKFYGYASIPYFAVFEATKNGQPHLHILCRVKWIEQRVLSAFMKEEIDAPIVDIRRCGSARAAAQYVSKYVGKAPGKFGTCKRYWQTRDYRLPEENPTAPPEYAGKGWRIVETSLSQVLLNHGMWHNEVFRIGPVWVVFTRAPPERQQERGRV